MNENEQEVYFMYRKYYDQNCIIIFSSVHMYCHDIKKTQTSIKKQLKIEEKSRDGNKTIKEEW